MSEVEVRQLRYFIAVAEELHFGRAASRLDISQPPLSRAIQDLERQLDVRLLERSTRQVTLTPAGEVLLREARTALDAVTAATHRAQHAGRLRPSLRVAFKADYDAGLLPRILETYAGEERALPVELLLGGQGEQVIALVQGRADVAMLPTPFDNRGLDSEPLLTENRMVALPADDPLAARTSLRLDDLAGRTLPNGSPADQDGHVARPADQTGDERRSGGDNGAPGATGPRRLDLAQIFNLVELGTIVWFPPVSVARRHRRPGIAYRPVADLAPTTISLAWPQNSRSPAVAAFVRVATTIAATHSENHPASEAAARQTAEVTLPGIGDG